MKSFIDLICDLIKQKENSVHVSAKQKIPSQAAHIIREGRSILEFKKKSSFLVLQRRNFLSGGPGDCGGHLVSSSQMGGGGEAEFQSEEVGAVCRTGREQVHFILKQTQQT